MFTTRYVAGGQSVTFVVSLYMEVTNFTTHRHVRISLFKKLHLPRPHHGLGELLVLHMAILYATCVHLYCIVYNYIQPLARGLDLTGTGTSVMITM